MATGDGSRAIRNLKMAGLWSYLTRDKLIFISVRDKGSTSEGIPFIAKRRAATGSCLASGYYDIYQLCLT